MVPKVHQEVGDPVVRPEHGLEEQDLRFAEAEPLHCFDLSVAVAQDVHLKYQGYLEYLQPHCMNHSDHVASKKAPLA